MKNRSKFLAFILNAIPGLGLLYYGDGRGLPVGLLTLLGIVVCGVLGNTTHIFFDMLVLGYMFMILVSEVMLFTYSGEEMSVERKKISNATVLSFIPGLGHMYMGMMEKGLIIFAASLMCLFLTGWLGSALFIFILPVILAYSIFDVKYILENKFVKKSDLGIKNWMGYFLIASGIYIMIDKFIMPYISYQVTFKLRVATISLGMIAGGLMIIKPELFGFYKKSESKYEDETKEEVEDVIKLLEEGEDE